MASHLFAIGDVVSLNFQEGQVPTKVNPFTIEARMPHLGTVLQYRIKSDVEAFRRVVAEHQISSFGGRSGGDSLVSGDADPSVVVDPRPANRLSSGEES